MNSEPTPGLNQRIAEYDKQIPLPREVIEVIWNSIILASRSAAQGLPIGTRAPEFTLRNAAGQTVSSKAILSTSPLVVCFLRGDWCPFCRIELEALCDIHTQLSELGARLVAIHPEHRWRGPLGNSLPFDLCSDVSHEVMEVFNVRYPMPEKVCTTYRDTFGIDLKELNAGGLFNLPVPATFVIDRDGIIKGRQFDPDFRLRAEPSYILSTIIGLPHFAKDFVAGEDAS